MWQEGSKGYRDEKKYGSLTGVCIRVRHYFNRGVLWAVRRQASEQDNRAAQLLHRGGGQGSGPGNSNQAGRSPDHASEWGPEGNIFEGRRCGGSDAVGGDPTKRTAALRPC